MPAAIAKKEELLDAARKCDFAVFEQLPATELARIANLQYEGRSSLWLSINSSQWGLARKLIMVGADVGFVKLGAPYDPITGKKDKNYGCSILSKLHDILSLSKRSDDNSGDLRDIEELIEIVKILLCARGQALSCIEKFDIDRGDASFIRSYEELMKKISEHFPTDNNNYLAHMPIEIKFNISQYLFPEWCSYPKQVLTLMYVEFRRRSVDVKVTASKNAGHNTITRF